MLAGCFLDKGDGVMDGIFWVILAAFFVVGIAAAIVDGKDGRGNMWR